MLILPIERCQEANAAFNAFTKDMSQLTQHMWEEVSKKQFEFLRLCQDCGERQFRLLGNGFSWRERVREQTNIATDSWRQALSNWRDLCDSVTETSAQLRASVNRIEPFWTPAAWEEVREKVVEAVDAARNEAQEQLTEAAEAAAPATAEATGRPRKRVGDTKNKPG